jgi:hypothetical protein
MGSAGLGMISEGPRIPPVMQACRAGLAKKTTHKLPNNKSRNFSVQCGWTAGPCGTGYAKE